MMADLYGQALTKDTVRHANARIDAEIVPATAAIQQQLRTASVTHFDETGLRVAGKLHWVHVATLRAPTLTHYTLHPKRGATAMKAGGILPQFTGAAVHDHLRSYFKVHQGAHALCNAHHLRELTFIHEQYHQPWAAEMIDLLLEIKEAVDRARPTQDHLPAHWVADLRYTEIVQRGLAANPAPDPPPVGQSHLESTPTKPVILRSDSDEESPLTPAKPRPVLSVVEGFFVPGACPERSRRGRSE